MYMPMTKAKEIDYVCNLDNPQVMSRLLTEHKVCEKEIGRLRDVLQKLIEAGNAAIKGDYSDWDFVVPEAEALLTTTGATWLGAWVFHENNQSRNQKAVHA